MEEVIAEHQSSDKNKVVAKIAEWKGRKRLDIREMFRDNAMSEWKHGKGVTLPIEVAPGFVAALNKAMPAPVPAVPTRKLTTRVSRAK